MAVGRVASGQDSKLREVGLWARPLVWARRMAAFVWHYARLPMILDASILSALCNPHDREVHSNSDGSAGELAGFRAASSQQLSMLSMLRHFQICRCCWAPCSQRDLSSSSCLCLPCYTSSSHGFTHSHIGPALCHASAGYNLQNVVYEQPLFTRHLKVDPSQGTQV